MKRHRRAEPGATSRPLLEFLVFPVGALLLCLPGTALRAEITDGYIGVRSTAMGGAHRGLGTSNDAIFLNPAGMALSKRYSVDLGYGRGGLDGLNRLHVSALDSRTSAVAGALSYSYIFGNGPQNYDASLHHFSSAAAYPLLPNVALGIGYKTIRGSYQLQGEKQEVQINTGDVGLAMRLGDLITFGVAYQNLLPPKEAVAEFAKPAVGMGVGLRSGRLSLAADGRFDMRRAYKGELSLYAGAEYFLGQKLPFRLGWKREPFVNRHGERVREQVLSMGLGWITKEGAFEISYSHSLDRPKKNWNLLTGLKFFM